jgi:hypothetical protein
LTRLEVTILESPQAMDKGAEEPASLETDEDVVELADKQRCAARELIGSLAQLLRAGVANAGVVMQSGLLRGVHQCRAEGLHRLAALGLRVVAGSREFRARAPASDPGQLADDIADILETACHVLSQKAIASFWIGTARRKQLPVRPRKLHGLFAEPIVTRSGFSGAAVYFLGEDGQFYTASDVRPGDAQHARDAYLGGIEIGPIIQPAKQLARNLYVGTDLTASVDGRLGRGKGIKIVEQGRSTWQADAIQDRFRQPLADQWHTIYKHAELPADARPAGWDFVFLGGAILGAVGPELLLEADNHKQPIRLAIENESESLRFRENLRMLSHAPGLRLQIIGRVSLQEPTVVSPLALAPLGGELQSDDPRLQIPDTLAGRICLGFDEIKRQFLTNSQASPIILAERRFDRADPLESLRRRWVAAMLSGLGAQRHNLSSSVAGEVSSLHRRGFVTGAALLDALSSSPSRAGPTGVDTFLGTALYLRGCSLEFAKSKLTLEG